MKHAGAEALDRAEPLLKEIRRRDGLKEKTRGNFYRGSRAFLGGVHQADEIGVAAQWVQFRILLDQVEAESLVERQRQQS